MSVGVGPRVLSPDALRTALALYLVMGPDSASNLQQFMGQAIDGGVTMVQWRDKSGHSPSLEVIALCRACQARSIPFIVNDNISLAKKIGADGVHLGQDDMPPAEAREALGPTALIGLSVGSDAEAARYDPTVVDYVGIGPLFPTTTKTDAGEALGWQAACDLAERQNLDPCVFIGGVSSESIQNIRQINTKCSTKKLAGFAVVSAITKANTTHNACAKLLKLTHLILT